MKFEHHLAVESTTAPQVEQVSQHIILIWPIQEYSRNTSTGTSQWHRDCDFRIHCVRLVSDVTVTIPGDQPRDSSISANCDATKLVHPF